MLCVIKAYLYSMQFWDRICILDSCKAFKKPKNFECLKTMDISKERGSERRQPPPHSFRTSLYLFAAVRVPIGLPNLPQTVFREWSSIYNRNFYLKLIRLFKHGSPSIVSLEALWGYAPPQLGKMRFGSCVGEVAFPRSSKRPSYCVKYVGQLKCCVFMFI